MEKERLLPVLKTILLLLSQNKYAALAELDYELNMQTGYIETAIKEYGGKLTIPSDELIIQQMKVFETQNRIDFMLTYQSGWMMKKVI